MLFGVFGEAAEGALPEPLAVLEPICNGFQTIRVEATKARLCDARSNDQTVTLKNLQMRGYGRFGQIELVDQLRNRRFASCKVSNDFPSCWVGEG